MNKVRLMKLSEALLGTHWYRNSAQRGAFHLKRPDWVRSGKAVCGAAIKNPALTVTSPMPLQQNLCKRCLKAVEGEGL